MELDRVDEDKSDCPNNCQWISRRDNIKMINLLFGIINISNYYDDMKQTYISQRLNKMCDETNTMFQQIQQRL